MIDVPCPQCGVIYHAEWAHLGKCIKCSRCGAAVLIIESAKAVVPSRYARHGVRPAPSAQFGHRLRWRLWGWLGAIVCSVALITLFFLGYMPGKREVVNNSDLGPTAKVGRRASDTETASAPKGEAEFDLADVDKLETQGVVQKSQDASPALDREPRPKVYESLPTGTPFCDGSGVMGKGILKIQNGTFEDAAIRLYDVSTKRVVRCLFVKAHDSLRIAGIREGTYDLNYTTGLDWQTEAQVFRWLPTYSRFGRQLVYSEEKIGNELRYREIEVTLHPVIGGNVQTNPISREEFLRGAEDASLQR